MSTATQTTPQTAPQTALQAALVVPCFNEAARLDGTALLALADAVPELRLVLVNDGSADETKACLLALAGARPERITVIDLAINRGKAEAVRQGLLRALASPADVVGYFDADLSTPTAEIARLLRTLRDSTADVVIGSRIARLGSAITRQHGRHYVGRLFASVASLVLRTTVYDTQCGAKLFRRTPALEAAVAEPFLSRWAFDVELLGRLLIGSPVAPAIDVARFLEVPLEIWTDVPGSKLDVRAMAGALRDLASIERELRRRRARA